MGKEPKRRSGVLLPVFSLFGDYSTGGFSFDHARRWIDFLAGSGFSVWQVLPLCPVDDWHSPYKSYSAFAGNPYFIDLEAIFRQGLLTERELTEARQKTPYVCEYDRLDRERIPLLKKAAQRVTNRGEIQNFVQLNPEIEKYCQFMALKEENHGAPWTEWTKHACSDEAIFPWQFIQYEFFRQWEKIHAYAASRGVSIMGDVPVYVAMDSADVWASPQLFRLRDDHQPEATAGVPPDYFSPEGQLWGNPLYDWDAMRQDGYDWWRRRLREQLKLFDGVRLDHFRGFEAYWAVPYGAASARSGHWEKGPGKELMDVLCREAAGKQLLAEDLGDITPEVEQLRDACGLPGMRVFQFAFLSYENPHLPHAYSPDCVAYSGTHDNNTLLGYLWELDDDTRRQVMAYCGYDGTDWDHHGCAAIIRTMLESAAGTVIFPVQDLLGFGSDTRVNTPGRAEGNWSYRLTQQQLESLDTARLHDLMRLYRR